MTADAKTVPADLPEYVSFESGARLLVELGIVPTMNGDAVRYIARTRKDIWPFGEVGTGHPHTYVRVANARTMATGPFLEFFRKNPPSGRGPDKKPRNKKGSES
ncbi:MAG: hypothetical protein JWO98_4949 [Frankiales bacterium]|nr:hypothetical protein [Frankiales bacterium]